MLEAADVLVVNQQGTVGDMAFPSKLTSYFAAGRPIIAATALHSETAHEIHAATARVVVPPDDPLALAAAIRDLKRGRERSAELGKAPLSHRVGLIRPRVMRASGCGEGERNEGEVPAPRARRVSGEARRHLRQARPSAPALSVCAAQRQVARVHRAAAA
jgi:colanic acid biosynthesis glycosyl transferase WcaI